MQTILDALGRLVRVSNVIRRVVIGEAHDKSGSFPKKNGFDVVIIALPVEVPLFDQQKPLFGAIGKKRITFQLFSQIMSVRAYCQEVHVHRQGITFLHGIILVSWRDINGQTSKIYPETGIRRRLSGEVKSNAWLNEFGLACGMQV